MLSIYLGNTRARLCGHRELGRPFVMGKKKDVLSRNLRTISIESKVSQNVQRSCPNVKCSEVALFSQQNKKDNKLENNNS